MPHVISAYVKGIDPSEVSSGGLCRYTLQKLLDTKIVDNILAVFDTEDAPWGIYKLTNSLDGLAKSKYVRYTWETPANPERVAIVCLPCDVARARKCGIKIVITLLCGGPRDCRAIADKKNITFRSGSGLINQTLRSGNNILSSSYNCLPVVAACGHCKLHYSPKADMTLGDDWLNSLEPRRNLAIVRNEEIWDLLNNPEIAIQNISDIRFRGACLQQSRRDKGYVE